MQTPLADLRFPLPSRERVLHIARSARAALRDSPRIGWIVIGILLASEAVAISLLFVLQDLPNVSAASSWIAPQSIVVEDGTGKDMYYAYNDQDRLAVSIETIPDYVQHAFIAVEDKRFYSRGCIDARAIARAAFANLSDYKSQGASTMTQQLVRTAFLNRKKLIQRKIRELILACDLEQHFTKEEILELYLNWIPFGHGIAGIGQASQHYFGVTPQELSVGQAAILASLPQRPSYFSPYGAHRTTSLTASGQTLLQSDTVQSGDNVPDDAIIIGLTGTKALLPNGTHVLLGGRANHVLNEMENQEYIDHRTRLTAEAELFHMTFRPHQRTIEAPHYALSVLDESKAFLGKDTYERGGFRIRTTIDSALQTQVEDAVSAAAPRIQEKYGAEHIAVVAADMRTREVLAYVGNTDFFSTATGAKIDMARVPRQPGSSFKPFVYAAAFDQGNWQPYTTVQDSPLRKGDQVIHNYDNRYMGPLTALKALNYSRNTPAVRAYDASAGEDSVLQLVSALGAPTPQHKRDEYNAEEHVFDYGWPLAIGAAETPLFEMVQAYATLGNGGEYKPLTGIKDIRNLEGDLLWQPAATEHNQALNASVADTITAMLSEERARPAGYWRSQMHLPGIDAAVKTGTSNTCAERRNGACIEMLPRDLWTIGYTPDFVVGVWVGNADGTPLTATASGLGAATPLWKDVILAAHETYQKPQSLFADTRAPYYRQHKVRVGPQPQRPEPQTAPSWIGDAVAAIQ